MDRQTSNLFWEEALELASYREELDQNYAGSERETVATFSCCRFVGGGGANLECSKSNSNYGNESRDNIPSQFAYVVALTDHNLTFSPCSL